MTQVHSPQYCKKRLLLFSAALTGIVLICAIYLFSGLGPAIAAGVPVLAAGMLYRYKSGIDRAARQKIAELEAANARLTMEAAESGQGGAGLMKKIRELENLLDASLEPIICTDTELRITRINKAFCQMLKVSAGDMLGKPTSSFSLVKEGTYECTTGELLTFDKSYFEAAAQAAQQLNRQGFISDWKTYFVRSDGRAVPILFDVVFVRDDDGQQTGIYGVGRDVTEQRKADIALIAAKEQLEKLIDISSDPILISGGPGTITRSNRAFLEMSGFAEEEVLGKRTCEISVIEAGDYDSTSGEKVTIDSEFFNAAKEHVDKLRETGFVSGWQSYCLRKDGKVVPVVQNIATLFNEKGERVASYCTLHDMTGIRMASQELIREKNQVERLFTTSIEPIVISNEVGYITRINQAFINLTGYSADELVGKGIYEISLTEEGTYQSTSGETIDIGRSFFGESTENIEILFEQKSISGWQTYYHHKDGRIIPIMLNIVLLYDEQGARTGSFAIVRDLTDERMAELARMDELKLIREKAAAEEANHAKSAFLANMSHEIRTPMNGVVGFTDMLLETSLSDEQRDFALTIQRSADALLSLLNDILDFSKIEAGKIDFEEIDFDIEVLAYDVCDIIRPRLGTKPVEIMCRIDDNLPAQVRGDPHRFKQVLNNLMGNAAKFIEAGEIELSLDIEGRQNGGIMLHTSIRDTGIGIPVHKLGNIFNLFEQADISTTRHYGGTGLGLAICRQIARMMGGDVWAESKPDVGSTFHYTALLKEAEEKQVRRVAPVALTGKKVLIADDNPANLEILMHVMQSAGMRAVGSMSAKEALQTLHDTITLGGKIDICILDIKMPGMDGYELAQRIRALYGPDIPLLAFSSSIVKGAARQCQAAGFNGFLPKPANRIKMFKMMERLLGEADSHTDEREEQIITQHTIREDAKRSVSILLAEDNPVNQKLAVILLTKAGYQVAVANNGQEAVDMYSRDRSKYDIIFMDVQMPILNGLDATSILREKGFMAVPIIAMTAQAMRGDREKCIESGMNDYVAKPIKRDVVFEMLRKWILERPVTPDAVED